MAGGETPRSWSVAPTLAWFSALLIGTLLVVDGSVRPLTRLIEHRPGEAEDRPSPGPGFTGGGGGGAGELQRQGEEVPPLPPPHHSGTASTYSGQTIEDPCVSGAGDDCARAMDPFYAQLAHVEQQEAGALARVSHYGDSMVADDYIAARARERLQSSFGDGGAGFVFLAQPNRWYHRQGVEHSASNGWTVKSITGTLSSDGLYGVGGTSFEAIGAGASATFRTTKKGPRGDKVSRYELYYLAQPKGGGVDLEVDGVVAASVDTKGAVKPGYAAVSVADGAHTLKVKVTGGRVRAFGVVMERDQGAVYENMGVVSGSAKAFTNIQGDHWREQLAHRAADLIVVMLGTNEAGWIGNTKKQLGDYEALFAQVIAQIRKGRPGGACLVMAPLDSAEVEGGKLVSKPVIPGLVAAQRAAAQAQGCAFWDTYTWMGGKSSAAKWGKKGLLAGDYTHPTKKGGAAIADGLFDALMAGFDAWKAKHK